MYILFLLINFIFSFIFFSFSRNFEAIFFILIWLLMFFYFSPFYFWKNKQIPILSKINFSKDSVKKIIPLFQKTSYLIAFFFFYISLYWISYSFWWDLFPLFIMFLTLFLYILYFMFLNKQKEIINLVYRSNILILSSFYLILFFYKIFIWWEINSIFIINSILWLVWLFLILAFDFKLNNYNKNYYYLYFLFYINIFSFFILNYFFILNLTLLLIYIWLIFSILIFEIFPRIKFFYKFEYISKYYWIYLNYLITIFCFILLFNFSNIWHPILILFIWIFLHYFVHKIYKNYLSLILVLITLILFYIKYFIPVDYNNFLLNLIFIYILPLIFISYTFFIKNKYEYDNYFINFSAIIFSIVAIILYFIFSRDFDILHISIITLFQSFLLFWSFIKLKSK